MAGWTTLRLAHAPTHRPPAAHKLHRAPTTTDQIKQDKKQKTLRRTATPGPSTDTNFGASKPSQTTPISTIFPTQPSIGSKPATFPKSPVTFAEIRTRFAIAGARPTQVLTDATAAPHAARCSIR